MQELYYKYKELSEKLLHDDIMNIYQFENLSNRRQRELVEELEISVWQWRDCL